MNQIPINISSMWSEGDFSRESSASQIQITWKARSNSPHSHAFSFLHFLMQFFPYIFTLPFCIAIPLKWMCEVATHIWMVQSHIRSPCDTGSCAPARVGCPRCARSSVAVRAPVARARDTSPQYRSNTYLTISFSTNTILCNVKHNLNTSKTKS